MNDFNNIETDPIPEGLEFNERYMQDAFALYDAEKQKRKRRLLIWWFFSSTGFAALLLTGIYFFSNGGPSDTDTKHALSENKVSGSITPATQTGSASSAKTQGNRKQSAETNEVKKPFASDEKLVKSTAVNKIRPASTGVASNHKSKTRSKFSKNNRNKLKSSTPVFTAFGQAGPVESEYLAVKQEGPGNKKNNPTGYQDKLTGETIHDSLSHYALTVLPMRAAYLAFPGDTTLHLITRPDYPHQSDTDFRKHGVSINLGVNTLFGMKELQNRVTFRESIGVSYTYRINPKFTIGAGLEYHSISRISYKRKVGDTTKSDNTTTILNKTTLNYISFLPQVQYHLWPNHTLNAGFGIEYLLVDPGERYEIDNYTQETPKRTNSKLYYSTFNQFNFSVSLGYTYQFSRFMAVHASYYYGLTDITRNTDFNKTFDRNSRLQIGLKIKLY